MNHPGLRAVLAILAGAAVSFIFASALRADDAPALYKSKCAACHAADGSGDTPAGKAMKAPDLRSEEVQKQTDAMLIDSTANGKGKKMPAYKDKLTGDQIRQLVGYIRELANKK
ncbi:MAG: c-type cytochrome [Candidatus Acidiferrales bacterium]